MVSLQAALAAIALSGTGETVMLDFYADWCGPCRAMSETVQALVDEGRPVKKINIDKDRALAAEYGVRSIPCYVMLVDGQEVDRVVGGTTFSRLDRMYKFIPKKSAAGLARAAAAETPSMTSLPPVERNTPFPGDVQPAVAETPARPLAAVPASITKQKSLPGWAPENDADAALIAASVRLRIEDPDGHSCGSGTIIDARGGEALILTCGHIFRESQGKGRIEVDLFGPNAGKRVPAQMISYDLKRDIGLISIRVPGPVATARVAPPDHKVAEGDAAISLGCNNGDRPSAQHSRVTGVNRALGPPNLYVKGLPVEGRSGGGLFSEGGLVIGVCNAADQRDQQGFYAGLASIHAELDRIKLAYVYNSPSEGPRPRPALVAVAPPPMPKRMPRPLPHSSVVGNSAPLSTAERAALEDIRRERQEGAEVIFVVRSKRDPAAKSEIFTLENASASFLEHLAAEFRAEDGLQTTSLEIPSPPRAAAAATPKMPPGDRPNSTGGWRAGSRNPR